MQHYISSILPLIILSDRRSRTQLCSRTRTGKHASLRTNRWVPFPCCSSLPTNATSRRRSSLETVNTVSSLDDDAASHLHSLGAAFMFSPTLIKAQPPWYRTFAFWSTESLSTEKVSAVTVPDDIRHNEETPLHNQVTHDATMASKSSSLALTFEASEFANRWRWPTRLWEVLTAFNALPVTIARLSGPLTLFPFSDTPSSSFSNVASNAWSRIVPAFSSKDSRQNTPYCSGWRVFKGESAAPSCRAKSNSSRQRRAVSMSRATMLRRSLFDAAHSASDWSESASTANSSHRRSYEEQLSCGEGKPELIFPEDEDMKHDAKQAARPPIGANMCDLARENEATLRVRR